MTLNSQRFLLETLFYTVCEGSYRSRSLKQALIQAQCRMSPQTVRQIIVTWILPINANKQQHRIITTTLGLFRYSSIHLNSRQTLFSIQLNPYVLS